MITLIFFYMLCQVVLADDVKPAKIDFYKGAQEFINEVDSIMSNKQQLKKIESDEKFEDKVENIETLERSNMDLSIKSFESYIAKYPNSPYVPDALYRLSKLYYEDASQKAIKDTENYEKEYQKFLRGETQVLPPDPVADYSKAIKTLKRLTDNYRDYKYRNEALYLAGYVYFEQGNIKNGTETYNTLIREYPKSDKLAEVYTRLGEYYFDSDDLSKAVYYYSQVLEYPDSPYYENVLYKLAWTYYHKKKIDEASGFFASLLDYNEKKFGPDHTSSTINEAKNYIAMGYAEFAKGVKGAYAFFRRIGGRNYEYEIMRRITEAYCSSDRIKEARESFNFIIDHYPYHPENPIVDEKLLNSINPTQNLKLLNIERDRMIQLFGEGSVWREKNKDDPKALATAEEIIKKQLIAAALYHQKIGDDRKSRKEYIKAARLYYEFLRKYPMDGLVAGARYNYAKVLFNLHDYKGAIKEYTAVQDYTEDEGLREESSFSVVTAWQNRLITEQSTKYASKDMKPLVGVNGKLLPPNELNAEEASTVMSCQKYEKLNQRGQRLARVWYIEAGIYFRNNMFEKARKKYNEIIENYPKDKTASESIRSIIASYTYEKNYPKVEEWSKKFLALRSSDQDMGKDEDEIRSLMTGSVFNSAKGMEEEGRYEEAANEYIRLERQYPNSEYADAALYNAGLMYEKRGDANGAIRSYNMMLDQYPKSKHSLSAMFRVATNYEQQLDFGNAMYFYGKIIKKYPKTDLAVDSNYNSGRIRRAYNQYEKAANHFMAYSVGSKDQQEGASALILSGSLYERSKKYAKALNAYEKYIKDNNKDIEGVAKARIGKATVYDKMGKKDLAYKEYEKLTDELKVSGNPSGTKIAEYNAEAMFRMIQPLSDRYHAIRVKALSVDAMRLGYEKKQELLQKLSEEYLKVISLGSPEWSVGALYMMGYEFQEFADFLYKAPVPKEINTEQLKGEYKSQVQTQAMPYEDKATEYYEKCISESARLKVANDWTKGSRQRLAQLKPKEYKDNKDEITVVYPSADIKDHGFVGK
jgi:cellulose synthase operon protein C